MPWHVEDHHAVGRRLAEASFSTDGRSLMNVTFVTGNESLDEQFIKQATSQGFDGLKGHRSVGGMRASLYNAMPIEGVQALVAFMRHFESTQA